MLFFPFCPPCPVKCFFPSYLTGVSRKEKDPKSSAFSVYPACPVGPADRTGVGPEDRTGAPLRETFLPNPRPQKLSLPQVRYHAILKPVLFWQIDYELRILGDALRTLHGNCYLPDELDHIGIDPSYPDSQSHGLFWTFCSGSIYH